MYTVLVAYHSTIHYYVGFFLTKGRTEQKAVLLLPAYFFMTLVTNVEEYILLVVVRYLLEAAAVSQ